MIDQYELDAVLARCGVRVPLSRSADRPLAPAGPLVAAFAELIGDGDEMTAASYAFQSVISMLASPTLTGALVVGVAPVFEFGDVRWRPGPDGPRLGIGACSAVPRSAEDALANLLGVVDALAQVLRGEVRIARRLLLGNAAASLLGVLRRLALLDQVDGSRCSLLAASVVAAFGRPPVATIVELDGWTTFQRRTCCLLRFAGARGVCDECSLLTPAAYLQIQDVLRRRSLPG